MFKCSMERIASYQQALPVLLHEEFAHVTKV